MRSFGSIFNSIGGFVRELRACDRGNVAVTFALATIPVVGGVGAAVDYSRANSAKSALQAAVGLGQSALSQHLARLREAGMVATRREGQTIHYRISDPDLEVLMQALYAAFCQPRQDAPARPDQD